MSNSICNQFKNTWLTSTFTLLLFCAVTYLLYWNENQAIAISQVFKEAGGLVTTIDPYAPSINSEYEGKLVHLVGPIEIMEPLTEPDYNIQVLSAKLKKRVQMYQWIEEARNKEDTVGNLDSELDINTYTYYTDWRDYLVDSNLFYMSPGHHNPKDMPMSSQTYIAENVKIGYIFLGIDVKKKFNDYYDITSDERPDRHDIKLHSGAYYHGADPLVHEVGDLRVIFSYAGRNNDEYSIIGILEKSTIQSYISENSLEPLALLRKGKYSAIELLTFEFKEANRAIWRYRIVGWFQMFAAAMSLHPDWLSLFLSSKWVSHRLRSHGKLYINLIFSTCATFFIMAIAWLLYSPFLSLIFLNITIAPLMYYFNFMQYFIQRFLYKQSDRTNRVSND